MVELKKILAIVLYCIFIDHKIRHEIYITNNYNRKRYSYVHNEIIRKETASERQ